MNPIASRFLDRHGLHQTRHTYEDIATPKHKKQEVWISAGRVEGSTEEDEYPTAVLEFFQYPTYIHYSARFLNENEVFEHDWNDAIPASSDYFAQLITTYFSDQLALF